MLVKDLSGTTAPHEDPLYYAVQEAVWGEIAQQALARGDRAAYRKADATRAINHRAILALCLQKGQNAH